VKFTKKNPVLERQWGSKKICKNDYTITKHTRLKEAGKITNNTKKQKEGNVTM
jgi:hypothetical protein